MTLRRNPQVEILSSHRLFEGRIFDLVEESLRLPSGLGQDLAVVDHPGAVAIVALDHQGEMLLVRQYRHAVGDWLLEIPAGRLEKGEAPLAAAQRELEEETGHRAAHWELLREFFPAPGFCSERIIVFLASGLTRVTEGARPADHDEEIELYRAAPLDVFIGEIRIGESAVRIADAKTLIAAALISRLEERGRDPRGS
jgi:8-oxo-dGTP pyrophosphatase MutT (NUDIX family)